MRFPFAALLVSALVLTSCADAALEREAVEQDGVLYVADGEPQTRVQLGPSLQTQWTAGDLLTVFYFSDQAQKWQFDGKTGDTSGTISLVSLGPAATFSSMESLALYPYSEDSVRRGSDEITTVFPREQEYAADSFGPGAAMMLGWSYGKVFKMYHLCGFLDLRLTGERTVRSITLWGNNYEALNGQATIDSQSLSLVVAQDSYDDDAPSHSIVMDCAGGVSLSADKETSFIFALAPETFELGISALVEYTDGTSETRSCRECVALRRNSIVTIHDSGDEEEDPEYDIIPYTGETADDAALDVVKSDGDLYWEVDGYSTQVVVTFNEGTVKIKSPSSKIRTHHTGAHATIDLETYSVKDVEIVVRGVTSDGSLKVYADKKYKLTLDGVDITSKRGPAINSQSKKRVFVHLTPGTTNYLCDASSYGSDAYYLGGSSASTEDRKGCFFAEGHMIFSGSGVLVAYGMCNHAVATDGFLLVRPGVTLVVPCAEAHGIKVKGSETDGIGVRILGGLVHSTVSSPAGKALKSDYDMDVMGGKLVLNTYGDAYFTDEDEFDAVGSACAKVDGDFYMSAGSIVARSSGIGGKGINVDGDFCLDGGDIDVATSGGKIRAYAGAAPKGIKVDGEIVINGGSVTVNVSGKTASSEGIEAKKDIHINGGEVYSYAYDDGINSAKSIFINGGRVFSYGVNNDGIDAYDMLKVTGGLVIASGCDEPEEAFDCYDSDRFIIEGGTLIGTSGYAIAPSASLSLQNTLLYKGIKSSPGTLLSICDGSGTPILMYEVPRSAKRGERSFSARRTWRQDSSTASTQEERLQVIANTGTAYICQAHIRLVPCLRRLHQSPGSPRWVRAAGDVNLTPSKLAILPNFY